MRPYGQKFTGYGHGLKPRCSFKQDLIKEIEEEWLILQGDIPYWECANLFQCDCDFCIGYTDEDWDKYVLRKAS